MADIGAELVEPDPAGKPGARRIKAVDVARPGFAHFGVRGDLSEFADCAADRDFTGESPT